MLIEVSKKKACPAFVHVIPFPSPIAVHPQASHMKQLLSLVLHHSHQKMKQQSHQNTRIHPPSFLCGGCGGLGILLSLTCFSMLACEFTLYLSLLTASAFVQCGYKKKIHTLMPVAFPEGGERHWDIFTVVKNETQENFSTAT